ncbi:MAG: hypothetical protein FD149_870 [Rhodospirillaceae bacterium]|nr:MAG: hypothetical protein FD149_870 [Rhodospirillaceae bacterium]
MDSNSDEARPCDPDDIYRAVVGLLRQRRIEQFHLRILATYGLRLSPLDPRIQEETQAYHYWDEAIDRLSTILKTKGIVLC